MAEVMNEEDVSTEALLQLLRRAFLKATIDDDGDVYITDGLDFPIWVSVDTDQRLIRFFTFMQRDEGRPFTEAEANHANARANHCSVQGKRPTGEPTPFLMPGGNISPEKLIKHSSPRRESGGVAW